MCLPARDVIVVVPHLPLSDSGTGQGWAPGGFSWVLLIEMWEERQLSQLDVKLLLGGCSVGPERAEAPWALPQLHPSYCGGLHEGLLYITSCTAEHISSGDFFFPLVLKVIFELWFIPTLVHQPWAEISLQIMFQNHCKVKMCIFLRYFPPLSSGFPVHSNQTVSFYWYWISFPLFQVDFTLCFLFIWVSQVAQTIQKKEKDQYSSL